MQIKLTPDDVKSALLAHLAARGLATDNNSVSFIFYNRRTKGGIFAEVTIGAAAMPADTAPEPVHAEAVALPAVVTEPVVETPVVTAEPVSLFG
jgi:dihydroxyacetone kinase DhaKLM complex PTS-EIIA-like component DhaM